MSDPSHEDQHLPDEDPIEGLRRQLKPVRDAELAPEVDRELLLKLIRRELSTDAACATWDLVFGFKSWNDAYIELLRQEFPRLYGNRFSAEEETAPE